MHASRPVIAFALLRQCSELMQTDLLSGVSVLIKPLVADLAGEVYDARLLAERMAASYGLSFPAAALESFTNRLVSAEVLRIERNDSGINRAIYCHQDNNIAVDQNEENAFQEIIDDFLSHAEKRLKAANIEITGDRLVSGFLHHLATLDFSAIRAKPILKREEKGTIVGPAMKEQIALSEQLADEAVIDALVASYVSGLRENNEARLTLLAKVADGALGAELVLDLQAPQSVQRLTSTTIVVDTPLILSYLDLSSQQDTIDTKELLLQIVQSGAKIAAFQHSVEEAEGVLKAINNARSAGDAYGPSIHRLSNSTFRAYFESMGGKVAKAWTQTYRLEIIQETPTHYYKNFTEADEEALTSAIRLSAYDRVLTRERDAKSVAETMRRLGGAHIPIGNIASCKYLFVTSNSGLQRRSVRFLNERNLVGKDEFVPVVTSRYLSGLCWLICGGKSSQSPTTAKLLSNCAAALRLRPELADRTKRFLAGIDPEKARHFEALMTDERASQYLIEVSFGNPELITANNVEEIFEEVQRRAAEKVGREKDMFYAGKIADLSKQIDAATQVELDLRDQLITIQIEADARKFEVRSLSEEAKLLRAKQLENELAMASQRKDIGSLETTLSQLSSTADTVARQLLHQRNFAIQSAGRFADRMILSIRIGGAISLFVVTWLIGYADKLIIPNLSADIQRNTNLIFITFQAILSVLGLSLLLDFLSRPLKTLRNNLYVTRLAGLGIDACQVETAPLPVDPTTVA